MFDVRQLSLATSVVCHVENRLCHYWLFLNLSVFNSGLIRLHAVYCASSVVRQDTLLCKRNKSRRVNLIYKCYNCYICQTVQLPSVSCNTKKNTSLSFPKMWFTHILVNNKRIIYKILNVLLPWYITEYFKFRYSCCCKYW